MHTRLILVCQSATSPLSFSLLELKQRINRIFIFRLFQRALRVYDKKLFLPIFLNIFRLFHFGLKDNFRYQESYQTYLDFFLPLNTKIDRN